MLTKAQVIQRLKAHQGEESLRALARHIGCSAAYLSDIYKGKREPGPRILKYLGLEKLTQTTSTYVSKTDRPKRKEAKDGTLQKG